jgi:hypothetical protein
MLVKQDCDCNMFIFYKGLNKNNIATNYWKLTYIDKTMKKFSKVKMTMFIGDLIAMFCKTIVMANKKACIGFLGCL